MRGNTARMLGSETLDCESPTAKARLRRPDYKTVRAQSSCDEFAVPEPESEAPELAFPSVAGSQRCACDDSFVPDVVPDGRRLNTSEVTSVLHGSGLRWCSSHPMPHSEQARSGPKRCPEAVGRSVDSSRLKCPVSPNFVDPKDSRSELSATSAASAQSVRIGLDRFHDGQNSESIAGHRVGRADAARNPFWSERATTVGRPSWETSSGVVQSPRSPVQRSARSLRQPSLSQKTSWSTSAASCVDRRHHM